MLEKTHKKKGFHFDEIWEKNQKKTRKRNKNEKYIYMCVAVRIPLPTLVLCVEKVFGGCRYDVSDICERKSVCEVHRGRNNETRLNICDYVTTSKYNVLHTARMYST